MFKRFTVKFIVLSTYLLLIFLQSSFAQETKVLFEQAKSAIEKNNFDEAALTLDKILVREPKNDEALAQKARVFYFQKKNTEAFDYAEKALAINPKNLFALTIRGIIKRINKDYLSALLDFSRAIEIEPTFHRAHYQMAMVKIGLENLPKDVLAAFDLAIKYSNGLPEILGEAGDYCLTKKVSLETCSAYFTLLKQNAPQSPRGYLGLGLAYTEFYDSIKDKNIFQTEAIPNFKKAIELNPKNETAPLNLGRLYLKMGNNSESIVWLTKASELNPKRAWTFTMLGESFARKNEFEQAIANYDKAIALDPKYDIPVKLRKEAQAEINKVGTANNGSANLTLEGARLALIALVEKELDWRKRSDQFNTNYQKTFLDRVGGLTAQEKVQVAGLKKEGEDLAAAYKNYNYQYQTILQNSSNGKGFLNTANANIAGINESLGLMNRTFPGVPAASPNLTSNDARIALLALVEKELDWHKRTGDFNKKYQASFLDRVGGLTPAERTELNGYKKEGENLISAYKNYNVQYQSVLQSGSDGKKFQDSANESINSINKMLGFINRLLGS